MIRVEEELKHQRELMQQGFAMMDKRFEAADKRFEEITSRLDRFMVWSFSTTVTVGGLVVAILKLWN
jgi:hypothetical protein